MVPHHSIRNQLARTKQIIISNTHANALLLLHIKFKTLNYNSHTQIAVVVLQHSRRLLNIGMKFGNGQGAR